METAQEDRDEVSSARSEHSPLARASAVRTRIRSARRGYLIYRVIVGLVGSAIVIGGLALVPLPGPGWLIVFVGLAILASEFAWAARVENYARRKVLAWTHWVGRQHIAVRLLIGLATMAFVAAVTYGLLVVNGVPEWVPDNWVPSLPGLSP